jgi:hypothetical protein
MPVTNVKSKWVSGSLAFLQDETTDGQVLFGQDDTGLDVKMFGATSGKYVMWDESADTLYVVGTLSHTGTLTLSGDTGLTGSLTVTKTGLGVTDGRVAKFVGTVAAPAHADGYGAVEIDITASGTFAGPYVAASSTWLNYAAAAVPGAHIITPHNDGVYVPSGITSSSATVIMGGRFHYIADDGANPGSLYVFSTNIYSNALTAIFHVNAAVDITWATGTKSGGTAGNFPFFRDVTAGVTHYVNTYTA